MAHDTQINVVVNILLLAAKGIAALWSNSLSLIASLVDSALDLLCTLIIWSTNRLVGWKLKRLQKKFPVGRRRLEPIGILVFSIIMIVSFLQILQESVKKLLPSGDHTTATLPPAAIFSMVATIVVKGTIWIGCARVKTTQVQALAQDCKTDVYFNTLSLAFPLIGHQLDVWWLDPVGATILSLVIIYDWAGTCIENVTRLSGEAADDRTARKMLYMAWRFAPLVEGYKMIKSYHAGDGVWVEMDVLMDEKAPLRRCHDVAETLQYCTEGNQTSNPLASNHMLTVYRLEGSRSRLCDDGLYVTPSQLFHTYSLTARRYFARTDGTRDGERMKRFGFLIAASE